MANLESEFKFFLDNKEALAKKYKGKVLVIHSCKVWKAFKTELEALERGNKQFGEGNFLIQVADSGEDAYSETFYSRVAF